MTTPNLYVAERSSVHPEVSEAMDAQIAADRDWFAANPKAICHFRPATPFDAQMANRYGQHLLSLNDLEQAPLHFQTWIALVDVFRLQGLQDPPESARVKFRCLPVDFDDPQQVEYATATAIQCAQWALKEHKNGRAAVGYVQSSPSKKSGGKGFA